jgi:hypothetical protein
MRRLWQWIKSWFTKPSVPYTELDADEDLEMQKNPFLSHPQGPSNRSYPHTMLVLDEIENPPFPMTADTLVPMPMDRVQEKS